jgi:(p)ppGpp synthase/HD superfamily hydrolase
MSYNTASLSKVTLNFAKVEHETVNHKYAGYLPYEFHLNLVAQMAKKYEVLVPKEDFQTVLAACYCHDVLEDTHATYNDLVKYLTQHGKLGIAKTLWGSTTDGTMDEKINAICVHVAEIVYAVTNNKGRTRAERADVAYYQGIIATKYATFVKLCDRLANVLYGSMFQGGMLKKYKEENEHFILSLTSEELTNYDSMVKDLENLFNTGTFNFNKLELT